MGVDEGVALGRPSPTHQVTDIFHQRRGSKYSPGLVVDAVPVVVGATVVLGATVVVGAAVVIGAAGVVGVCRCVGV